MKHETKGFCWNSRRWLFMYIGGGVPSRCVYQEQGNNECKREDCEYYEKRKTTASAQRNLDALWSLMTRGGQR